MATVYSLICFGGRTGKNVTISIASPAVVTLTRYGLWHGNAVVFSSTGALPTGITAGVTYYIRYLTGDTFNLYDTSANAIAGGTTGRINTSGSQSGTHSVKGEYRNGLTTDKLLRYGASGAERIYDGFVSWCNARRSAASVNDSEVCEIGDAFADYIMSNLQLNIKCASLWITPTVNGAFSSAYHNGILGSGYKLVCNAGFDVSISVAWYNILIENINLYGGSGSSYMIRFYGQQNTLRNCFIWGAGTAMGDTGVFATSSSNYVYNNVIGNCQLGITFEGYASNGNYIFNNTVVKCTSGFIFVDGMAGFIYNNISIGNTTNWGTNPTTVQSAGNNAGESTNQPWYKGADTSIKTLTTAHFVNYSGNDLRLLSTAPVIDTGAAIVNIPSVDLHLKERPNYNNGAAEYWDIGAFEYDHGFIRPASTTVTFSGVNAGSEIRVYDASGNELTGVESCTANPILGWTLSVGNVTIRIVNVAYKIKEFDYTPTVGAQTLPVQQEIDKWYKNPV